MSEYEIVENTIQVKEQQEVERDKVEKECG